MTTKPKLLIHGQKLFFHPLVQGLADVAELVEATDALSPADHELLVIDGEAQPADDMATLAKQARAALEANRAVLLLHSSAAHKRALADADVIITYIEEDSAALLIEPRLDADGKLGRGRGLVEQFFPKPGEIRAKRTSITEHTDGRRELDEDEQTPELLEPRSEDYANFAKRLAFVVDALATGAPLTQAPAADGQDPMQPPPGTPPGLYYVTDLLINRNWTPSGSKDKSTETPPDGHMSESGHVQVGIYYDNVNTPPQHWVKVYHDGDLQTGGPVNNSKEHRGWSLAQYSIEAQSALEGTQPDGSKLAIDEVSPTNVNGATQYTSSTSFSVGLQPGTDGLQAPMSYSIGSSQTIDVTDWTVAQLAPAHWQFYQQVPYDGRTFKPNNAVDKSKGVKSLPPISLYGTQYNAQSVWVHQPASPETRTITYSYASYANYAAWRSGFWGYHWCLWQYSYGGSFTLNFRFDLVQPS